MSCKNEGCNTKRVKWEKREDNRKHERQRNEQNREGGERGMGMDEMIDDDLMESGSDLFREYE